MMKVFSPTTLGTIAYTEKHAGMGGNLLMLLLALLAGGWGANKLFGNKEPKTIFGDGKNPPTVKQPMTPSGMVASLRARANQSDPSSKDDVIAFARYGQPYPDRGTVAKVVEDMVVSGDMDQVAKGKYIAELNNMPTDQPVFSGIKSKPFGSRTPEESPIQYLGRKVKSIGPASKRVTSTPERVLDRLTQSDFDYSNSLMKLDNPSVDPSQYWANVSKTLDQRDGVVPVNPQEYTVGAKQKLLEAKKGIPQKVIGAAAVSAVPIVGPWWSMSRMKGIANAGAQYGTALRENRLAKAEALKFKPPVIGTPSMTPARGGMTAPAVTNTISPPKSPFAIKPKVNTVPKGKVY